MRSVTLSLIVGTKSDSFDEKYLYCLFDFITFSNSKPCQLGFEVSWNDEWLYSRAHIQEQLKAAHIEQEKKKKRESAAREANKMKLQEHENKVRGALLDAFTKEDQERLQKNARKRLGEKEWAIVKSNYWIFQITRWLVTVGDILSSQLQNCQWSRKWCWRSDI